MFQEMYSLDQPPPSAIYVHRENSTPKQRQRLRIPKYVDRLVYLYSEIKYTQKEVLGILSAEFPEFCLKKSHIKSDLERVGLRKYGTGSKVARKSRRTRESLPTARTASNTAFNAQNPVTQLQDASLDSIQPLESMDSSTSVSMGIRTEFELEFQPLLHPRDDFFLCHGNSEWMDPTFFPLTQVPDELPPDSSWELEFADFFSDNETDANSPADPIVEEMGS